MKCWTNRWKKRAVKRQLTNRKLEKRIKELIKSRDLWKDKSHIKDEQIVELQDELKKN